MKPRDYCCCALPLVNAGIYAAILEHFVLGLVVGILSMSTPSIVGAATPSFAPWILGIVCLVGAAIQVLGLIAVSKAKIALIKRYTALHLISLLAAFAVAAAWIIISATRHSTAQTNCVSEFFKDSALKSQGETLCNIFAYADVGIMGGLWVFFAITQTYLYIVLHSYPASYEDRMGYDKVGSSAALAADTIPMSTRGDFYPSDGKTQNYNHVRQDSAASLSDVMNEPSHQPQDGYSQRSYDADSYYPSHPTHAHTQEPGPTPGYSSNRFRDDPSLSRPVDAKYHPGE